MLEDDHRTGRGVEGGQGRRQHVRTSPQKRKAARQAGAKSARKSRHKDRSEARQRRSKRRSLAQNDAELRTRKP